jgi:NADH:ubiquinone oxidoreductase subunit F (NADH-binding)
MGSGGMIVLDEDTCMVDMAKYFVSFCAEESCGQCTPCREGVEAMKRILTGITEGHGRRETSRRSRSSGSSSSIRRSAGSGRQRLV